VKPLRLAFALVALLAISSCAPVATVVADAAEKPDGASLTFLTDGVGFDPGDSLAVGTQVFIIGDTLTLVEQPAQGLCEYEDGETTDYLDCRLGDVSERIVILVEGTNRFANASFRRAGDPEIFYTRAQ